MLDERLISRSEQVVAANEAKGLHLAADNEEHGLVTYLQQVTEGGFFVYVGDHRISKSIGSARERGWRSMIIRAPATHRRLGPMAASEFFGCCAATCRNELGLFSQEKLQ